MDFIRREDYTIDLVKTFNLHYGTNIEWRLQRSYYLNSLNYLYKMERTFSIRSRQVATIAIVTAYILSEIND